MIDAPARFVWEQLTRIERMKEWMGGPEMEIEIDTDWDVGGPIAVSGLLRHARVRNTGVVLEFKPPASLSYTHLSSLSRLPDEPESYTTLSFTLQPLDDRTSLTLVATGFPTVTILKHLQLYWRGTLGILKQHTEQRCELEGGRQ